MNKKGFTLIEILGVVVVLGLLLLVVAPPLINRINTHETEVTDVQKQMVEEASDLYLDSITWSGSSICVSINTLKDKGFLNTNFKQATKAEINSV